MKPLNPKIHRIGRNYFWIALILCLIIGSFFEVITITAPTNVQVAEISYDENGNLIETVSYKNSESTWMFGVCLVNILFLSYFISLVIKRYHDVGKSTLSAMVSIVLIPFIVGIFLIVHVGLLPSDDDNIYGNKILDIEI